MAEIYAIIMMLENFDNVIILTNEEADLKEGVDFILVDLESKIAFPMHVTAQTAGKNSLNEKERRVRGRNNNSDVPLYYSKEIEGNNSFLLGEFAFFKKTYLRRSFNDWKNNKNDWHPGENLGYKLDNSEFIDRCVKHGGNWELFKSNKIEKRYGLVIKEIISLFQG